MHTFEHAYSGICWEIFFFSEAKTRKWWRTSLKSLAVSDGVSKVTG